MVEFASSMSRTSGERVATRRLARGRGAEVPQRIDVRQDSAGRPDELGDGADWMVVCSIASLLRK